MGKKVSALETKRFYRVKKPVREFLCALCSAPRQMKYSKNLSAFNYAQIALISVVLIWSLSSLMGAKALFMVFPVWLCFELGNKLLYRRELPCPYCGFDPSWYRRDVTVANKMVKNFWQENYPDLVNKKEEAILNQDPAAHGVVAQSPEEVSSEANAPS